jgi:hypothetical protein
VGGVRLALDEPLGLRTAESGRRLRRDDDDEDSGQDGERGAHARGAVQRQRISTWSSLSLYNARLVGVLPGAVAQRRCPALGDAWRPRSD